MSAVHHNYAIDIVVVSRITRLVYHPVIVSSLPFAMLDHGGSLCLEEHSKSKLVYSEYTASMCKINKIKTCYWLFYFAYSKIMPVVTQQP